MTWPQHQQRPCPLWVLVVFEAKLLKWFWYRCRPSGPDALIYRQFSSVAPVSSCRTSSPGMPLHCTAQPGGGKVIRDNRVINDATCVGSDISPFHLSSDYFKFLHRFNSIGSFFSFPVYRFFLFLVYTCCRYYRNSCCFPSQKQLHLAMLNQILRKSWVTEHRVGRKIKVTL